LIHVKSIKNSVVTNLILYNHTQTIFCLYFSNMERQRKSEPLPIVAELGKRIKEIIENKNLKQREVAHDAGMDVENLRKYLKGTQEMKVSTLFRITTALGISPSELLEGLSPNK
jgi:DNA-binding Xre family transcriptional regulator